ncbi:hypothetical protein [Microbacterium sp. cx-59]|uniref:hypothetical protein n=1 Tax=Microbacterium sp. cx-59 TaxID=2891207 RepID=UPI001E346805|nr:hypothetical protein [Microbacterium sp. cx-59]MCC4908456.1 hypothetical protein [Microbacterium sp. cx-59]
MGDLRDEYLLNLEALHLTSERVQAAYKGDRIEAAAIETHFGLHAVYDLHEAYFKHHNIATIALQDDHLEASGGQSVGALALARGARTHNLVTVARTGGFGDLPYGMGPYGGGWIWKEHTWNSEKFTRRACWYDERVRWRYLHNPLDDAWAWFLDRIPAAEDDTSG